MGPGEVRSWRLRRGSSNASTPLAPAGSSPCSRRLERESALMLRRPYGASAHLALLCPEDTSSPLGLGNPSGGSWAQVGHQGEAPLFAGFSSGDHCQERLKRGPSGRCDPRHGSQCQGPRAGFETPLHIVSSACTCSVPGARACWPLRFFALAALSCWPWRPFFLYWG